MLENAQPFLVQYKNTSFALAHNGNLTNAQALKKELENDGSIFSALPAQIESNIKSLNNPDEKILGYFIVSGVDAKRIRIPSSTLTGINEAALMCRQFRPTDPLPEYCYDCTKFENSVGEEPSYW